MSYITYTDDEMEIVKSGIEAIRNVLMGTDMGKKESLLFCLDRFLDPWFGYQLPYQDAIVDLLQVVIVSDNTLSVKEAALQLICDYAWPPFPVLEENFERVEAELRPDVSYVMHMDKEIETDS